MLLKQGIQQRLSPASSYAWDSLPAEIAADLLGGAHLRRLQAGESLFGVGDPAEGCYRVDTGVVKLCLASQQGEECIVTILSPGAIVGDFELIDGLVRSSAAVALSDATLSFVSRSSFHECAKRHPEIYQHFCRLLAKRLQEAQQSIAALTFLNARGRVAYALLTIAGSLGDIVNGGEIVIPRVISQKELAALAGVARENINRIFRDWEQRKLLSRVDHCYRINDARELEREMAP